MPFDLLPSALQSSQESQSSDLGEDDMNRMVEESKPVTTKRSTCWGMNKFIKWMEKRNISVDLKTVTGERLNEVLRKFFAEVKSEKSASLTPSALTGIRAAIQRALKSSPYNRNMNIVVDREFTLANHMFQARCKLYYKNNNRKPQHKRPIEKSDMILLGKYFEDPSTNPVKLVEFVWFSICLHFGRRGREGWRILQNNHFVIKSDADGKRYVATEITETIKNLQGGNRQCDQDYSDSRMYEVPGAMLCPVRAFEKYVEKLNPDNVFLFQHPVKDFDFQSQCWYTKEVLGKNTLSNMMKTLSRKAGLKNMYTNHCVRASTITVLYQAGVDTQQICAITKHKNEGSLKHYIGSSSDKQKQLASNILSAPLLSDDQLESASTQNYCLSSQQVASTSRDRTVTIDFSSSSFTSSQQVPCNSQQVSNVDSDPQDKMSNLHTTMANATFQNCTINFYGLPSVQ